MAGMIFSHQRCGSTALRMFVARACKVRSSGEPFNNKRLTAALPGWRDMPRSEVRDYCAGLLDRVSIVKHIYGQFDAEWDRMIAGLPNTDAILLLYRQDAYAAALSGLMARRLGGFSKRADRPLGRIEIGEIEDRAAQLSAKRGRALETCRATGKPLLTMTYEQIFADDEAERRSQAAALIRFFNESAALAPAEEFDSAFTDWLMPAKRINSSETFRQIENHGEIAARFPSIGIAPSRH